MRKGFALLFFSDALTGAGHQTLRASIQAGVGIFNVPIHLWLIPLTLGVELHGPSIASAIGTAVFFTPTACAEWFF